MQNFGLAQYVVSQVCDNLRLSHCVLVIAHNIKPETPENGGGLILRVITKTTVR